MDFLQSPPSLSLLLILWMALADSPPVASVAKPGTATGAGPDGCRGVEGWGGGGGGGGGYQVRISVHGGVAGELLCT